MTSDSKSRKKVEQRRSTIREIFALDFRSLALFRILTGLVLLADLVLRFGSYEAMCTDDGAMPRWVVYNYFSSFLGEGFKYCIWSFHWISGEATLQYVLMGVAAVFAVAMMLGWKTRWATIGSWILLSSLQVRNPLILTSGDAILKLLLMWSIFLPLGKVWSLDAKNKANVELQAGWSFSSMASAGFILQLIVMYFFTGLAKCNSEWFSGNAMEYVMRLNIYLLPLGETLRDYPVLLTVVTYATLFVEVIGIWWLLSPYRNSFWRMVLLCNFWAFHIGIGLTMAIGLFPMICLVGWLALIPSSVWNWFSDSVASDVPLVKSRKKTLLSAGLSGVLLLAIVYTFLFNIANIEHPVCKRFLPREIAPFGFWLNLDQRFQMFGRPPKDNPWFVYEAQLQDGSFVDLLKGENSIGEKKEPLHLRPEKLRHNLPGHHWRKLHRNLVNPLREQFRQPLLDYQIRKWNREHGDNQQIVYAKLFCHLEPTNWEASPDDRVTIVWASYRNESEKALNTKIDKALDQLLEDSPLGSGF